MKELTQEIKSRLDNIDENLYPRIAETIKTTNGYDYVADMMVNMMLSDRMSPGATIYHIENML